MLKSMTGFGRCENVTNEYKISVEMKAVNHRYLDLSIKMPKKFNYFEASIRTLLKEYIQRGKVDLFINYEDYTEGNLCLKYNSVLAAEYMDYFQKMSEQFGIANDMTVSGLSRCPEVLTMEQVPDDEEHLWEIPIGTDWTDMWEDITSQLWRLTQLPAMKNVASAWSTSVSYTHLDVYKRQMQK